MDNKAEVEKAGRGHYHKNIVAPHGDGEMASGFFVSKADAENIKKRAEKDHPDLRFVLLVFDFDFKDTEGEVVDGGAGAMPKFYCISMRDKGVEYCRQRFVSAAERDEGLAVLEREKANSSLAHAADITFHFEEDEEL